MCVRVCSSVRVRVQASDAGWPRRWPCDTGGRAGSNKGAHAYDGSGCALAASDRVGIAIVGSRAGPEEYKSQEIVDEMKLGGCICQG